MLMRLDCLEADLRREQNRREQAAVRGSSDSVLSSIDACIDFLRGQCKAMGKTIDTHVIANESLNQSITAEDARIAEELMIARSVCHVLGFEA